MPQAQTTGTHITWQEDPRVSIGDYLVPNDQPVQSYWGPVIIGVAAILFVATLLDQSDR